MAALRDTRLGNAVVLCLKWPRRVDDNVGRDPGKRLSQITIDIDGIALCRIARVKRGGKRFRLCRRTSTDQNANGLVPKSEEHTSELQSLMRISYAVFCLKKKKQN